MTDSTAAPAFPGGTILGYPRIGKGRELKKALESFWKGAMSQEDLEDAARQLRASNRERLAALGLGRTDSSIPSNFSFYDHMLDASVVFGCVPTRFKGWETPHGGYDLSGYSIIARGEGDTAPLEMTKWFDSNYHYLVPEIGPETTFEVASLRWVDEFIEAKEAGFVTRPVITGPLTFLYLSKASEEAPEGFEPISRLADLIPIYVTLLKEFKAAGADWVQIDEPILVADIDAPRDQVLGQAATVYRALGGADERPALFVAAPYNSLDDALPVLAATQVEAIGIDLVRGSVPSDVNLAGQTIVAGVVDGHNIWRTNLDDALAKVRQIEALGATVTVSSSTSLFHVPHTLQGEEHLGEELLSWLAFADEKVGEIATLATALAEGETVVSAALAEARAALASRAAHPGTNRADVRDALAAVKDTDFERSPYSIRAAAQANRFSLPDLATTTIGSFPQTQEIRKARAAWPKGDLSETDYEAAMTLLVQQRSEMKPGHLVAFVQLQSLISTMELLEKDNPDLMKWNNIWSTWSYVLLDESTSPESIKESLNLLSQQWDKTMENTHIELGLQPLGDIIAGEDVSNQIGPTIGATPVRILLSLTVLVLISACFNYTNLSVARALRRTKEVGVRKTIGALKGQVIGQFIVESVTISLLSLCFSFLLFLLIRPHFISMEPSLQELLRLELSPTLVIIFVFFALLIGVFAGVFPALSFSKINAIHAFKGLEGSPKLKGFSFRKALTVFQYSISIIAITATLILFKQYQHFIHYDFGFSTANILNIRLQGNQAELLANELRELSEVQEISQSSLVVGLGEYWGAKVKNPSDPTDSLFIYQNIVDENYLPLHGYGFVAGRNFHPKATDSAENEVIVNQQVLKRFGLDEQNPDKVLGQLVNVEGKDLAIVGVLKDFEYGKPTNQTGKEVLLRYSKDRAEFLNVKILSQDWPGTYKDLERIWKKIDPVHSFQAEFYEQQIQDSFKGMEATVKIGGFLSLLVICIASLGLLGMVVFTTELRIKEISIRKVMGSNETGLVFLLSKGFVWMLGIAAAIAIPATYMFFDQVLLPNIPNSLPLQLPEMTLGSLAILLLALLMTGFQALKVARSNPAEVLKSE